MLNTAIFAFLVILCSQVLGRNWLERNANKHFYIFPPEERPVDTLKNASSLMVSFYLMLNGLLPLDLVVIFMLAKFFYTVAIEYDVQLIDQEKSIEAGVIKGCNVKNLELLQDFSLLNNIFCDKTGTLTKN